MAEFCPECETMSERRIVDVEETLPVLGTPITIRAQAAQCVACGKLVEDERLDSISLQAAYDAYYRLTGIRLPRDPAKRRTPGLNRGTILPHPNFDDPLPDAFWNGE